MVPNNKDRDKDTYGHNVAQGISEQPKVANRDSALSVQVGGDHYRKFQIQPIVFTHCNGLNDIQSAVIWYICRYNLKGQALQDLKKAKHFIDILIELEGLDEKETVNTPYPDYVYE